MVAKTIRETLSKELFHNPRPLDGKLYQLARASLFPNEADFVTFLETDSAQEQTQRARAILLDFVFSGLCPPPSQLLLNLIQSQQQDSEAYNAGAYVPQDHFTHLVHLYLLGVYIFARHKTIHHYCVVELHNLRRALRSPSRLNTDHNVYSLFAIVWSQFVLYHDLGYPLERIEPRLRQSPEWASVLKPFTEIVKSINKDLSFKAAARLIVVRNLTDEGEESFEDLVLRYLDGVSVSKDTVLASDLSTVDHAATLQAYQKWRSATYLPRVTGGQDLNALFSCVDGLEVCGSLEGPLGEPSICAAGSPAAAVWIEPIKSDAIPRRIRGWMSRCKPEDVFRGAMTPDPSYHWRFFVNDPLAKYQKALKEIVGNFSPQFERITSHIEEQQSFRATRIKGSDSGTRLGALAYLAVIEMRGYLRHEDEEESIVEILRQQINTAARNQGEAVSSIPTLTADGVRDVLKAWLSQKEIRKNIIEAIRSDGGTGVAKAVLGHLASEAAMTHLEELVTENLEKSVVKPIDLARETRECTNEIRARIDRLVAGYRTTGADPLAAYGPDSHSRIPKFDLKFRLTNVVRSFESFTSYLDARLTKRKLGTFRDLVENYVLPWTKQQTKEEQSTAVDHGFAATVVALTAAAEYETFAAAFAAGPGSGRKRHPISFLGAALGLRSPDDVWILHLASWMLRSQAAEAIVLHNLYPESLSTNREYRTQLSSQPITFLAILADTLQRWDRPGLLNEAVSSFYRGSIAGSRYNVEIRDDIFHISLVGERADIVKEQQMRDTLRAYLKDADSLVKLRLEES